MRARITGLGQWLPPTIRENSDWPPDFVGRSRASDERDLLDVNVELADRIARRNFEAEADDPFLGSKRRRVADPELTAPDCEAHAARAALADAGVEAKDIDVVISWAAVPDRITPPSGPKVAHLVGATRAYAVGMDVACATTIFQLEYAAALIETGRAAHVLLTQSHLMTRGLPMWHPASPTVGDAATAVVVSRSEQPGIRMFHAVSHGEMYAAVTWTRGKQEDPPWWESGGAFYVGSKNSPQARDLVLRTVRIGRDTVQDLMQRAGGSPSEIDVLVSVQPRRWIPGGIVEALGLQIPAPNTFDDLAHLGGCGIVTNLIEARRQGLLTPGARVVLYGQGAGFTRGAALLTW